MHLYIWQGIDLAGNLHKGRLLAHSYDHAHILIVEKNIAPLHIRKSILAIIKAFFSQSSTQSTHISSFFKHLALLLKSGLSLTQALDVLHAQTQSPSTASALVDIKGDLLKGESFFKSLERHPTLFSTTTVHLVQAAEQAGKLIDIFELITVQLETNQHLAKKIKRATYGPAVTLFFALCIMGGIGLFIIPQFQTFFLVHQTPLPASTSFVLYVCKGLRSSLFWGALSILMCLCPLAHRLLLKNKEGRRMKDTFLIHIPIIGFLIARYNLIIYLRTLSIHLQAGTPLMIALTYASDVVSNQSIKEIVARLPLFVHQGMSLAQACEQADSELFMSVIPMIAVAEQSGALPKLCQQASHLLATNLDNRLHFLTTLLQPLLIIFIGVLIAFLLLSLYLPLFSMMSIL